jgi:hypothetical protein
MPIWLSVSVVVVVAVAVTGLAAYLIDRLNHAHKGFTTEDTEDTEEKAINRPQR